MAAQISPVYFQLLDRRRFLISAAATIAGTSAVAPVEQAQAAAPKVIRIGPPERPWSDIEAWNVGLITACRPELTPADNKARNAELLVDIRDQSFGFLHLRGRYIQNYGSLCVKPTDEHAYLVIGNGDDSGNLKGFLRKYGRKYDQDSMIHKGYYRDAHLHALRDLPGPGMHGGDTKSLGRFHPNRLGMLHTLITRGAASAATLALTALRSHADGVDWLGGRWEDIGLWTPKSFFNRVERRVVFDEAGIELGSRNWFS